jgi:Tfp pilus assembly protein PilF
MKRPLAALPLFFLTCSAPPARPPAPEATNTTTKPATTPSTTRPLQHADALAELDARITAVLARAEAQPTGWLVRGQLADLYLTRARLSGDYGDYASAEAQIDRAFAIAGDGAGPYFTRVALNFTLHRLDRVAADLDRIEQFAVLRAEDRRALAVQRADLAFQRGDYPTAAIGLEQALAAEADITNLARLALHRWKTGDPVAAEWLYQRALARLPKRSGEPAAWLHLQLGLMDLERGRWDDALAHYHDGAAELAGYWLIDEHIAEILTLQGKTDAALVAYADIIRRTGSPEFMDAVASIHLAAGRPAEARPWIDRARQIYEAQLDRFPEAAYGHALAHFLDFGSDPARVVELAESNHRTRPNAEAKISLARAYLKAGRQGDARQAIAGALATPWRSADLFAVAAEVYAAAGDPASTAAAADYRQRALAQDPHAQDPHDEAPPPAR